MSHSFYLRYHCVIQLIVSFQICTCNLKMTYSRNYSSHDYIYQIVISVLHYKYFQIYSTLNKINHFLIVFPKNLAFSKCAKQKSLAATFGFSKKFAVFNDYTMVARPTRKANQIFRTRYQSKGITRGGIFFIFFIDVMQITHSVFFL